MSWGPSQKKHRLPGPAGCLIWLLALIVILLLLSVLFGGFQKGTKVSSSMPPISPAAVMPAPVT